MPERAAQGGRVRRRARASSPGSSPSSAFLLGLAGGEVSARGADRRSCWARPRSCSCRAWCRSRRCSAASARSSTRSCSSRSSSWSSTRSTRATTSPSSPASRPSGSGRALEDDSITSAIERSLQIAVASAIVATVFGTAAALALSRVSRRVRNPFDVLVFLTLVVPELVIAVSSLIFFVNVGFELGPVTMFLAHTVFNASLVLLVVRARFVSMGSSLEEASMDLGASALATFRQVTLPRLAPAIVAGAMLSFTFSFDDVVISNFTAGAGNDTWPLRILAGIRFGLRPDLNAAATMMLGVTLLGLGGAALILRRVGAHPGPAPGSRWRSRHRPGVAERRTGLVYDERCLAHVNPPGGVGARDAAGVGDGRGVRAPGAAEPARAACSRAAARWARLTELAARPASRRTSCGWCTPRRTSRACSTPPRGREPVELGGDAWTGPGTHDAMLLAAGGLLAAVEAVLDGAADNAFALLRPPGHHAESEAAMGFCLFNNTAVAARWAQRERGLDRVAIVDWDVHHGNGTEEIFRDDGSVLTISLHQDGLYPAAHRAGSTRGGDGERQRPAARRHRRRRLRARVRRASWRRRCARFAPELRAHRRRARTPRPPTRSGACRSPCPGSARSPTAPSRSPPRSAAGGSWRCSRAATRCCTCRWPTSRSSRASPGVRAELHARSGRRRRAARAARRRARRRGRRERRARGRDAARRARLLDRRRGQPRGAPAARGRARRRRRRHRRRLHRACGPPGTCSRPSPTRTSSCSRAAAAGTARAAATAAS